MERNERDIKKLRLAIKEEMKRYFNLPKRPWTEMNHHIKIQWLLYEGFMRTNSVKETISHLINIGIDKKKIKNEVENNTNVIYISILPNKEIFDKIDKEMNIYGWSFGGAINYLNKTYNAIEETIQKSNSYEIDLFFVAEYDVELKYDEIPKTVYHLTPISRFEKIKEIGLVPKSKSKLNKHPIRVYLIKEFDETHIEHLVNNLFITEKMDYKHKKEYILLSIDIRSIIGIRLFNDPDSINSCYTLENIPPDRITPIRKYFLDETGYITKIINL